jgi:hypothetical protein
VGAGNAEAVLYPSRKEKENKPMKETHEEIRARLLRDHNVIENIQVRAYEIWILRGRIDGRQHEDWMLAENEVLNFLVEQEMKRAAEESLPPAAEEVAMVETTTETGPQTEAAPVKKPRKAAAPKAATTRSKAAGAAKGEAKESAKPATAKKTAAKRTATRKTTDKKSAKADQSVVK